MQPERLRAWEVVLQSDVAVALLLLGGVLVLGALLLLWVRALHQENRELRRELVEHLKTDADLSHVLGQVRQILDLQERDHEEPRTTD